MKRSSFLIAVTFLGAVTAATAPAQAGMMSIGDVAQTAPADTSILQQVRGRKGFRFDGRKGRGYGPKVAYPKYGKHKGLKWKRSKRIFKRPHMKVRVYCARLRDPYYSPRCRRWMR